MFCLCYLWVAMLTVYLCWGVMWPVNGLKSWENMAQMRQPLQTQTLSKIMTCFHLMTDRASAPHLLRRNLANCYYGILVRTCIWVFLALLCSHWAVSSRYTSCFQSAQRGQADPWGPHTHVELAGIDTHPGPETTGQAGSEGRAPCLWPEPLCHCLSPWISAQHNIRTCHCSYTLPTPSQ